MRHASMPRSRLAGIVGLTLALSAGCGEVNITGPDWDWPGWDPPDNAVTRTSEWRGAIGIGQRLEIKGVFGAVHAVRGAGTEAVVLATRIGGADAVDRVRIDVVRHGDGVTICAVYPNVAGQPPNQCTPGEWGQMSVRNGGRNQVRVDFTVQVPDGVTLVGRTLAGDLVASGLRNDAFLTTAAGDVRVSTNGQATATTLDGNILASVGSPHWDRDLVFSTLSGYVDVTIRATTNAQVWATAPTGQIHSDFALTHTAPGELRGTIGSGGPTLRLSTLSGNITLRSGAMMTSLAESHPIAGN